MIPNARAADAQISVSWFSSVMRHFVVQSLSHVRLFVRLQHTRLPCPSPSPYWMLGAGALGRPRGMVWGGRRVEGSGWGTHVHLWRIHFDIWQN